jgi:prepilin-type N-terminal cleavage/methylation domain-containing protein
MKATRKRHDRRGMTLMEVVIAIGIVAFVIPVMLTMTASSGDSLRSSGADTRSVWIAREVQREILSKWAQPERESVIPGTLAFPAFSSETEPLVLAFDAAGEFISQGEAQDLTDSSGIPGATYLVSMYAEAHTPPGTAVAAGSLSMLRIRVLHPAKSASTKRSSFQYNLITTRQGTL